MSERDREPLFFEVKEEAESEPETASAGGVRPPGRVGSGLEDDDGEPKDWRSVPIEDLNLSIRVYNRLRKSGLISLGHILASTENQILRSLQQPLERAEEGVLLTMQISGKRVQALDATASHKDWRNGRTKSFDRD